jgi:hypothetical protein
MITIAIVVCAFIAGVIVGIIALLCAGIAREESNKSLRAGPPNQASSATRRIVGLHVRMPPSVQADDQTDFRPVQKILPRPARPRQ